MQAMCTNGPSFPINNPLDAARIMPKNLAANMRSDSHLGRSDPERIVLSSGIPPVAALLFFPDSIYGLIHWVANIAISTTHTV
jgi:hypothetical protein